MEKAREMEELRKNVCELNGKRKSLLLFINHGSLSSLQNPPVYLMHNAPALWENFRLGGE